MKNKSRCLLIVFTAALGLALLPTTRLLAQESGRAELRAPDALMLLLLVGGVAVMLVIGLVYASWQKPDSSKPK